jgi:predicted regulator of Ras-like GTPase activity (Roadblock/LC7/MglB family)
LDDEDAEVLGAMSAAVFGEIDKATKRIGVGMLVDAIIDAEQGSILMLEARELILVVITQRMVNLGLVKMEMRRAAKRIGEAVPI